LSLLPTASRRHKNRFAKTASKTKLFLSSTTQYVAKVKECKSSFIIFDIIRHFPQPISDSQLFNSCSSNSATEFGLLHLKELETLKKKWRITSSMIKLDLYPSASQDQI
jgi:hypothetical protein